MPLYSDAGSGRLHSAFSEVISYIWTYLVVFTSCRTFEWQRRILLMWPWQVYGWWHTIWRGTETWIRWSCSRTCYWSVHTSWAAVQTKRTSVMKKLMYVQECTSISHGVLFVSSIVYDRPSLAGITSGDNSFAATVTAPSRISKNIGNRLQYLQCMEALHARCNSSRSYQIHQRRSLQRSEWLWLEHVSARVAALFGLRCAFQEQLTWNANVAQSPMFEELRFGKKEDKVCSFISEFQ